jgi:hypothetical protein
MFGRGAKERGGVKWFGNGDYAAMRSRLGKKKKGRGVMG